MGRWAEAASELDAAAKLAEQHNQIVQLVSIRINQASADYKTGNRDLALTRIRKLISLTERLNLHRERAALHNNLGGMLVESGDLDAAISEFDAARALAVSLGDSSAEAKAQANLSNVYRTQGDHPAATDAADQAWRLHQDHGDWAAAAKALLAKLHLDGAATLEDLGHALQRMINDGDSVTRGLLANLYALIARISESGVDDSIAEAAGPPAVVVDRDEPVGSPSPATARGRRIRIAEDVRVELGKADLAAVAAHLSTGSAYCKPCGLPIADDGPAELLLMANRNSPDADLLWVCLAHPTCATSTIITTDDRPNEQVSMDLECAFVGDGYAALYIDCRGGIGIIESGELGDGILTNLRQLGFGDVGGQANAQGLQLALPSAEPNPKLQARLVYDRLTLASGGETILAGARLDFYPSWYEAARRGVLIVMFGRRLEGMSTDNPQSVLRAAQAGQLVGAVVPLAVTPPGRNEKCPCSPRTGLKFKRCCGQPKIASASGRRR